ncbi:hypothetical protein [Methylotenera sp.]|uniref:hypothetical protein n=1 Tax=Methylotenera sp. TaxID=2051956 RepID=UPI002ED878A2
MTQAMKCQHDGEKITGWDEVTCRKCGWIVPSGQSMGIHDGWFPSHDSHKEYKKYRTYTGMNEVYPIDATTPQQPKPLFVGIDYSKDYVAEKVADALEEAANTLQINVDAHKDYESLKYATQQTIQAIRALIKRNAKPKECKWCNGRGYTETGIEESPTTICNGCDGMGTIQPKEGE